MKLSHATALRLPFRQSSAIPRRTMITFARVLGAMLIFVSAVAGAQRLPANVVPDHYDLSFTPDLDKATFAGSEAIGVRMVQPGRSNTLNAAEITFKSARITQEGHIQDA